MAPKDADKPSGKPSDHLNVVWESVTAIYNKPFRKAKQITVRPITKSELKLFGVWLQKISNQVQTNSLKVNKSD